jgi:epoxyqueuosine reductase
LDRASLRALALSHGLHVVSFTPVGETPRLSAFDAWLAAGHHADMAWLARRRPERADPRLKLRSAKTAIALAVHHHHRVPPDPGGRTGRVARYAWGRDYHNLVGKRLKRFARALRREGIACWGGVDQAPILERAWAEAAGIGAVGKNAMLLAPGRGSWFLLAILFVTVEVAPDAPASRDPCGSCSRCLDACPTAAFVAPRIVDAGRCVSYWTIEARGLAPEPLRPGFGRWLFGCDVCQEVCPHNHDPVDPDEEDLRPRHAWLDCDEILLSDDEALAARFLGTPLARAGPQGLKRNAAIVLGNLGDPEGARALTDAGLRHPAATVVEASRWALDRLLRQRETSPANSNSAPPAATTSNALSSSSR